MVKPNVYPQKKRAIDKTEGEKDGEARQEQIESKLNNDKGKCGDKKLNQAWRLKVSGFL